MQSLRHIVSPALRKLFVWLGIGMLAIVVLFVTYDLLKGVVVNKLSNGSVTTSTTSRMCSGDSCWFSAVKVKGSHNKRCLMMDHSMYTTINWKLCKYRENIVIFILYNKRTACIKPAAKLMDDHQRCTNKGVRACAWTATANRRKSTHTKCSRLHTCVNVCARVCVCLLCLTRSSRRSVNTCV